MKPKCYVIICGAIQSELTLFGPFDTPDEAIEYAETELRHEHWELAPVLEAN